MRPARQRGRAATGGCRQHNANHRPRAQARTIKVPGPQREAGDRTHRGAQPASHHAGLSLSRTHCGPPNGPHPTRAIECLAGAAASALCVTLALGDERRRCRQRPRWITSTLARGALGKRPNIRDLPAASLGSHCQLSAARCSQTHSWAGAATPTQRRTTQARIGPEGLAMCLR